jgi:hypothetical protein
MIALPPFTAGPVGDTLQLGEGVDQIPVDLRFAHLHKVGQKFQRVNL